MQPCDPCSSGIAPRKPMKASAPPIGWLIFSGLTEQAFFPSVTFAIGFSLRRDGERHGRHIRENLLDARAARAAAARSMGMFPDAINVGKGVRPDGIFDRTESDAFAMADFLLAPRRFGRERIGRERRGLSLSLPHRALAPILAFLLPRRRAAHLLPNRDCTAPCRFP